MDDRLPKEGREHAPQTFFRAQELYILDGFTYDEVATATGVSRSQIQRWATKHGWKSKRDEYLADMGCLRLEHVGLIQRLQKELKDKLDGQLLFAYRGLVRDFVGDQKAAKISDPPVLDVDRPALFLEDLNFIATYLKEKDPEGLKALAKNFDGLVARFKADHAQTA